MNKREFERLTRQNDTLQGLGFTRDEADKLRRISSTLQRWHELECGVIYGCIERDEVTGLAMFKDEYSGKARPIADRETGARKRLAAILARRNETTTPSCSFSAYIQGDPRGAALYIIRPGDVPEGMAVDSCYSRGICVY